MEPIFYRNKCETCGCWTIFEVSSSGEGTIHKCTHCHNETTMANSIENFKKIVKKMEKSIAILEHTYPQLRQLKKPGDYLKSQGRD